MPITTIDQFVVEVKKLGLKWQTDNNGRIRCEKGDCPVAALAKATLDKSPHWRELNANNCFLDLGRALGMSASLTREIAYAADTETILYRPALLLLCEDKEQP